MAAAARILILSEVTPETVKLQSLVTELKYTNIMKPKTVNLSEILHENLLILLKPDQDLKEDLDIVRLIKEKISHIPIITISGPHQEIHFQIAQQTNSILRVPCTLDILKKKLVRYVDPQRGNECRIYERHDKKLNMSWSYTNSKVKRQATTGNVCLGGVFVMESQQRPKKGDILDFNLQGANQEVISGKGIVRWISSHGIDNSMPGFGLEFIQASKPLSF